MDSPFFMDKRMEAQFGRLTADVFSSNTYTGYMYIAKKLIKKTGNAKGA